MKSAFLSPNKSTRLYFLSFFSLAALLLSLTIISQIGQAQQVQLSLADILIGLRSKKVTLVERNSLLTDAVKTRGITFTLTPEIEIELTNTGASVELIEAIRLKNQKPKVAVISTPTPKPVPTVVPTPVPVAVATPVPAPVEPAPDFAFYRKRGDENIFKGKLDLALVDYNKAIELNPKDTTAYLNRGRAYSSSKDFSRAVADYEKVIELNPKESMAYFNRGDSYEKMGDVQRAISDYQKAVELDASNEPAKTQLQRLQAEQAKLLPKPKEPERVAAAKPVSVPKPIDASQPVELGELNRFAVKLATPTYPEIAKKTNVQGKVTVQISLDEEGNVISAKAITGSTLLRSTCEDAARRSKFKPARTGEQAVKSNGFLVYNFATGRQ